MIEMLAAFGASILVFVLSVGGLAFISRLQGREIERERAEFEEYMLNRDWGE